MRLKQKMRAGASRVARVVLAGVLAIGLAPSVAFADLQAGELVKAGETAMSPEGYVKAAAHAAANPAPELLGLNNPNQRSAQEGENTYNFFGDPEININPDPYLYNGHNGLTPAWVIGGRSFASPAGSLLDYNLEDENAAQNQVWAQLPEIVLGTGSTTIPENESTYYADFARNVETGLGLEAGSYNPIGVTYNYTNLPTMIETMYRMAAAANTAIENSGGTLQTRYGDPMAIAKDYERYIVGQKGLVKQAIDSGKVEMRTIALVQSYDTDAHAYTIIPDGVAEGTATTNRALEPTQGVTNNYYASVEDPTRVTSDMLKENVDVIIIGGQSSMPVADLVTYLDADGLVDKTFYCTNWASGSVFVTYANSVENAQNVGRILPCVYPEVLDQSDMLAYYFETFYHVKTGQIAQLMAERLDGVRNWDNTDSAARTNWEESDYEGYNHDAVQAMLINGVRYLNGLGEVGEKAESYLTPTKNVADDSTATAELADSTITISGIEDSYTFTGSAITPEVIVKEGETQLVNHQDYLVGYSNNIATGTATVTVVGIGNYSGKMTRTFEIVPPEERTDINSLNIKMFDASYAYTGEEITIAPTFQDGDNYLDLAEGVDYSITVKQNGEDAVLKDLGKYEVTLAGMGFYTGQVVKQVSVVPFFSVNVKGSDAPAKSYSAAEFGALKSESTDPVSALYNASATGWNVATTTSYVTFTDLIADAGVDFGPGYMVSWEGKKGATTSYTYEELQAVKFFPKAVGSGTYDVTGAVAAPLVFALTQSVSTVNTADATKPQDAAAAEAANIDTQSDKGCPRTIIGISEDEYKAGSGAGMRLWNNINSITIAKAADYSAVDEAKAAAAVLDRDLYTDASLDAVDAAIAAVVKGKTEDEQADVDAMAQAINDAIAALVTKADQAANDQAEAVQAKAEADAAKATYEAAAAKAAQSGTAADAAAAAKAAAAYSAAAKAAQAAAEKAVESAKVEGSGVSAEDIAALEKAAETAKDAAEKAETTANEAQKDADNKQAAADKAANLSSATVTVGSGVYTGKAITPAVTVKDANGKVLKSGTDYTVAYKSNVNAGTATATVTGKGAYKGSKSATFTIAKANGAIAAKAKKKTVSIKLGKSLKASKVFKVTKNISKGKVTYKKTKGNKKIVVAKNGKITVKKGLKAGKTYTIKVKVTSGETTNYKAATSKVITVKVKVK